ncbi:MAG: hypothetical protein AAF213_01595 [Pseudomonadota bacterium]
MAQDKSDNQKPNQPPRFSRAPTRQANDAYSQAATIGQHFAPMPPSYIPGQPAQTGLEPPSSTQPGRQRSRRRQHVRHQDDVIGPRDEIIFEFAQRGQYTQVSAMHVPTLTEVSAVGSAHASEHELEQLALAKLRFVMRKKNISER